MVAPAAPAHVLALNGDPTILALLRATLEGEAYRVTTGVCAADLPGLVAATRPDLVLLDLAPGQPACRAAPDPRSASSSARPPVAVLSTQPGYLARVWDGAARYPACAVLAMPCELDDLLAVVARALA